MVQKAYPFSATEIPTRSPFSKGGVLFINQVVAPRVSPLLSPPFFKGGRGGISRAAFVILLVFLLTLGGCDQRPQIYQQQVLALGTLVDISLYGVDEETAAKAVTAVTNKMEAIHHNWHAWQPGKLTHINQQLAAGNTVSLSPEQQQLIQTGIELAQQSGDLFNPAAGKLIALWGFHSDERANTPPPADADISALVSAAPKMSELTLTGNQLSSANPAVMIDVGGYAKGYAVDQAIAELRRMGVNNAIVNAGGDLRAIGSKSGRPWRIGIRHPRQAGVIASLETRDDESIFTSGDYERYFEYQGQRFHHIIDPRSGRPAQGTSSVTILQRDASSADAAATAIFIAGPKRWRETARTMGIAEVMLIDTAGTIHMTEAMNQRVHLEIDAQTKTIVVP